MKTHRTLHRILVAAIIALLLVGCGGPKTYELKMRLKEGASYRQRLVAEQDLTQTLQGQTVEMKQSFGMGWVFDVKKVEADGTATIEVVYDWLSFEQDGPLGLIKYDSADPPDEVSPLALGFAAMLQQGFTMILGADGEVKDIQNTEEMLQAVLDNLDLPEGGERDEVEASLRSQFSRESLMETMGRSVTTYPSNPVKIGDSWSQESVSSATIPVRALNTLTLKSVRNGMAAVAVNSTIESNPDAPGLNVGGMEIRYDISGDQSGTMEIDLDTGWTLSGVVTQTLAGKVEAMGMSWPISVTSVVRIE